MLIAGSVFRSGRWYFESIHHRRQVDGLLGGSLALRGDLSALTHDLCWSQGGVHQVWGLGIPAWRLPFDAVARGLGAGAFPDMVALAIALGLTAWVVLRALFGGLSSASGTFSRPTGEGKALTPALSHPYVFSVGSAAASAAPVGALADRLASPAEGLARAPNPAPEAGALPTLNRYSHPMGEGGTRSSLAQIIALAGAAALLLLFPPLLNLLQSRFAVYEEVVAYEYLVGLGLIAALLTAAQSGSRRAYWAVCTLAGLGGFFRPTLIFHGAAAMLAGAVALWWRRGVETPRSEETAQNAEQKDTPYPALSPSDGARGETNVRSRWLRTVAVGVGLFVLGGGLLYYTNLIRFGNGFEFGHRLNVQYLYGSLYATRFDDPYQDEPLLSAARELFGWLFLAKEFNGGNFYQQHIFPGQSSTVRWRESYLTTYDLSYLAWLAAGVLAGGVAWWRLWRRRRGEGAVETERRTGLVAVGGLALYGVVASSLLLAFYLRNPVISSRYLLDLMPSFAALMLAGWLAWGGFWSERNGGRWVLSASALLLVLWLGWELSHSGSAYGPPRVLTWKEVLARRDRTWYYWPRAYARFRGV